MFCNSLEKRQFREFFQKFCNFKKKLDEVSSMLDWVTFVCRVNLGDQVVRALGCGQCGQGSRYESVPTRLRRTRWFSKTWPDFAAGNNSQNIKFHSFLGKLLLTLRPQNRQLHWAIFRIPAPLINKYVTVTRCVVSAYCCLRADRKMSLAIKTALYPMPQVLIRNFNTAISASNVGEMDISWGTQTLLVWKSSRIKW